MCVSHFIQLTLVARFVEGVLGDYLDSLGQTILELANVVELDCSSLDVHSKLVVVES